MDGSAADGSVTGDSATGYSVGGSVTTDDHATVGSVAGNSAGQTRTVLSVGCVVLDGIILDSSAAGGSAGDGVATDGHTARPNPFAL